MRTTKKNNKIISFLTALVIMLNIPFSYLPGAGE